MHDRSFNLIGSRQVHAVYTMHTYTCRTIYTGTAWRVMSSVPTLHRHYMYAMCSSVARLVMVFNFESLTVSTIAHKHKTQYDPVVVVQPCVACFDAHYVRCLSLTMLCVDAHIQHHPKSACSLEVQEWNANSDKCKK